MAEASEAMNFELAAVYRDRLRALTYVQGSQVIHAERLGDADIFALACKGGTMCIQAFFIRGGQNWGHRSFFPAHTNDVPEDEVFASFLVQFYEDVPPPRRILLDRELAEGALIAEALGERAERKVELLYVGPAHTTNDVVAWLPEQQILFAGDLVFNGGTPFVVMGSVSGSLAALDRLKALGPNVVVPGHGSTCGVNNLDDQIAYLRFIQEIARPGFEAGVPPLELALQTDLGQFAELHDPERLVGNLYRAYSELRGDPLGHPIDPQAYADMITYNGGQPLRCWA